MGFANAQSILRPDEYEQHGETIAVLFLF